jgi:homocitrate synthase NifV
MKVKSLEKGTIASGTRIHRTAADPSVRMEPPVLIDTTLRDGAQAADVVFNRDDRKRIARALFDCGIVEIEAGIPAMGAEEQETIKATARMLPDARIIGWCRAHESDLLAAQHCKCDTIHISFPVSDIHLACLDIPLRWVETNIPVLVKKARRFAERVTAGFQDASRAPFERLTRFAALATENGASRIRIADTVGILSPLACASLFEALTKRLPSVQFEFHGHNDLGMASANTKTAFDCGAVAASVTVGGIGERCGNAALEEVAAALSCVTEKRSDGFRMDRIVALCSLVSRILGVPIPANKPVTGRNAFRHEAGIHTRSLLRDARSFEPFPPQRIGRAVSAIVAGTHSGTRGIQSMLAASGIAIDRTAAAKMQPLIRKRAMEMGRSLDDHDVATLFNETIGNKRTTEDKDEP